jgi:PAS domain S-box-containing protein
VKEARSQKLEQKLQQCEERFVRFFHAAANALAITTINEGLILDVNASFAALAGYEREELLGSSTKAMGLWAHPEQREAVIRQLQDKGRISDLEATFRTKNGEMRTILFSAEIVSVNEKPCLLGMAIDISERKGMEEALEKSEEKYRILVEHSLQAPAEKRWKSELLCSAAEAFFSLAIFEIRD